MDIEDKNGKFCNVKPSGQCQSCLSDKSTDKEYMLTCKVCRSAIHNKHYGQKLTNPTHNLSRTGSAKDVESLPKLTFIQEQRR